MGPQLSADLMFGIVTIIISIVGSLVAASWKMGRMDNHNHDGQYVRVETCDTCHQGLGREVGEMKTDLKEMKCDFKSFKDQFTQYLLSEAYATISELKRQRPHALHDKGHPE